MFNNIVKSIKNNPNLKGVIIVVCYYFASSLRVKCKNKITLFFCAPIIILYKFITDIILGCEIPVSTIIGSGLIIHHGRCLVLNKNVVIGDNVTLKHSTTIGNKEGLNGEDLGSPTIGDNVTIGPNTVIIGPIKIGDNAVIGAGSVVVKDVEKNSVVAGNPAKLIKRLL
jgi:putative colanic acid biosynthesis acetyltransferase WcaB